MNRYIFECQYCGSIFELENIFTYEEAQNTHPFHDCTGDGSITGIGKLVGIRNKINSPAERKL